MTDDMQPIPGEEARAILEQAIRDRLGEDWDREDSGWAVVSSHDYMARLNKGRINIDFYVDLVGKVRIEEKPVNPGQDTGRLFAWMFLLASLGIGFLLAKIIGWL
ncbi:MAG: hypothetical protein K8J31_28240 [Anaerolineae bacterium]|jgi:hypothetical protein|nr:hypothetical protein [Anaerolineae bacterium]